MILGPGHNTLLETMVRMYLEGGDNLDQEMLSNLITAYLGSTQGGRGSDSKQGQGDYYNVTYYIGHS